MIWPRVLLAGSLSLGLGLGVSASIFFVLLSRDALPSGLLFSEIAVGLGSIFVAVSIVRYTRPAEPVHLEARNTRLLFVILVGSLLVTAACAVYGFVARTLAQPHGGWDAWAIWNLRARFLFRDGGGYWRGAVSPLMPESHPDYPLLVPGIVAQGWQNLGNDSPILPALVAAIFTFATVGVVVGALATVRTPSQGLLGGVALLATPELVMFGSSQCADIPLGFYMLVTIVLFSLDDVSGGASPYASILAGLTASLAAWTKNEGLLFMVAIILARSLSRILTSGSKGCLQEAIVFATGAAPILLLLTCFKLYLAPSNDLVSSQDLHDVASRVMNASRYFEILRAFRDQLLAFGHNGFMGGLWLLSLYAVCVGITRAAVVSIGFRTGMTVVALMIVGYFFVYVTTPYDLTWHLSTSLDRLIVQLWPSAVFLYFLAAGPIEQAFAKTEKGGLC